MAEKLGVTRDESEQLEGKRQDCLKNKINWNNGGI
jgi:hypothetical protein